MQKIVWVIAFLVILVSCQEVQRTPKPDHLIPEDKMVEVLTELSLLHGARSYNKTMMEEKGIAPYPYLMEKFGIDSAQLVQSNNYYTENYRQYNRIYERVKLRLESLLKEYDSLREIEERRMDSIRELEDSRDSLDRRKAPLDSPQIDSIRARLPQPVSRNINAINAVDRDSVQ